jgi:ABC-type dipeptide/oligopeptide/nickel transport system permease component
VNTLIAERLAVTATLALLAVLIILIISFPLGIFLSQRPNFVINNLLIFGLSIPNYITGIILVWLFGIIFRLFAPGGFVPFAVNPLASLYALFWPALAVAIPNACTLTCILRDSITRELQKDYVRTAYSKGALSKYVLYRHVLKNAACPVLTMSGILLADILSGSIVVEQVFAIPGIGRLLIGGINARDFPVVISIVLYSTLVVVTVHFAAELFIRFLDPRTRVA